VRPLDGVRVLELGNYMAGPFCGMLLADLGADVVKVENPSGGDYARGLGPIPQGSPDGAGFLRLNRNKRSLAIDLKRDQAREAFLRLARKADVVIENFRPGTMDDLGIGAAVLRRENQRLVFVSVSGFGQSGADRDRPGLDMVVQAEGGLMSVTGEEGGAPVKVGVPIADLTAALYAALAVAALLRSRERTGGGGTVDLSMLDASVTLAVWESAAYWTTGEVPRPMGSAHRADAPYQAFATADGHIAVGATNPRAWRALLQVTGLERLATDEWSTSDRRRARQRELAGIIEDVTRGRTTEEWYRLLREAGVPCGRIRTYDQVLDDPSLAQRGLLVDFPHATLGRIPGIASPLRIDGHVPPVVRGAPLLGEHTREVLSEAGLREAEIAGLLRDGAAVEPARALR
jgi:crotonobetainyl-CoA:carnitine CoA-transferase CaiB-like acyl-CoA transferase